MATSLLDEKYQEFIEVLRNYYHVVRFDVTHNVGSDSDTAVVVSAWMRDSGDSVIVRSGVGATLAEACDMLTEHLVGIMD